MDNPIIFKSYDEMVKKFNKRIKGMTVLNMSKVIMNSFLNAFTGKSESLTVVVEKILNGDFNGAANEYIKNRINEKLKSKLI